MVRFRAFVEIQGNPGQVHTISQEIPPEMCPPPHLTSQLELPLDGMRSNIIYPTNEGRVQNKHENQ